MNATTVSKPQNQLLTERSESSASIRTLQNSFLTELPGVAFAFLTLVYIVSSLARL